MGGLAMYAGFLVGMSVAFLMPFFADMRRGTDPAGRRRHLHA